ncbi:MAG: response regulator, partial [Gloeotrichia echinulata HAB0833]
MNKSLIRVLLVDDDEDDYILLREWLAEFQLIKCDLAWVDNYADARNNIAQNQHDIYLIDYRLGRENGLELLREAIKNRCFAPIILLTGQGDIEIDLEAM